MLNTHTHQKQQQQQQITQPKEDKHIESKSYLDTDINSIFSNGKNRHYSAWNSHFLVLIVKMIQFHLLLIC